MKEVTKKRLHLPPQANAPTLQHCSQPKYILRSKVAFSWDCPHSESAKFIENLKKRYEAVVTRETSGRRKIVRTVDLESILRSVEEMKGAKRGDWLTQHGVEGKWIVLHLGRHRTGMTLEELGEALGGKDYVAVSMGIRRFEKKLERDKKLKQRLDQVQRKLYVKK